MADYLIVPSSRLTMLQAVNLLISTLGESEVDTIDPPSHEDAAAALSALNLIDLLVQGRGWAWNSERDYPLAVDGDLKLPLPDVTLRAVAGDTEARYTRVMQRGDFLYDLDRRSFTFPAGTTLKVNLVARASWDMIPSTARMAITYRAAQQFHSSKDPSQIVLQVNAASVRDALTAMEQEEDLNDPQSTTAATTTRLMLSGDGGLIRSRQGVR